MAPMNADLKFGNSKHGAIATWAWQSAYIGAICGSNLNRMYFLGVLG